MEEVVLVKSLLFFRKVEIYSSHLQLAVDILFFLAFNKQKLTHLFFTIYIFNRVLGHGVNKSWSFKIILQTINFSKLLVSDTYISSKRLKGGLEVWSCN